MILLKKIYQEPYTYLVILIEKDIYYLKVNPNYDYYKKICELDEAIINELIATSHLFTGKNKIVISAYEFFLETTINSSAK